MSVRMDADLRQALIDLANERGESISDVIRRASLQLIGTCPTCGQAIPAKGAEQPPPDAGDSDPGGAS